MTLPLTITFDPPLPCSALGAGGILRCGKPARTGTIYPTAASTYLLQAFCEGCAAAMLRNDAEAERHRHQIERQDEEWRGEWEPDGDPFETARKAV